MKKFNENLDKFRDFLANTMWGNVLVFIFMAFFIYLFLILIKKSDFPSFKCPKEYNTSEEYRESIDNWIDEELLKNPQATEDELAAKRAKLFSEHSCEKGNWVNMEAKDVGDNNGSFVPMPNISGDENYGKDFKTYESNLGFSFKYPPHLTITATPDMPNSKWVVLESSDSTNENRSAIIISIRENEENRSAEEWLLGSTSGFNPSEGYFKTKIDGEDAVYTDGGMWTVINTPDNAYRLSIADLSIGDAPILFTEMGIVVESLTFKR